MRIIFIMIGGIFILLVSFGIFLFIIRIIEWEIDFIDDICEWMGKKFRDYITRKRG